MFGKTLLSIVALLFAGNQLVSAASVDAPSIDDCSTTPSDCISDGEKGADGFCYNAVDNKLYVINKANNCYKVAGVELTMDKVNVVKLDSEITDVTSSLSSLDTADIGKIAIYDCDGTSCERITGIIKKSSQNYFSIGIGAGASNNEAADLADQGKEYIVIDGTGNKALAYSYQDGDFKKNAGRNAGDNLCVDAKSVIWEDRKEALCDADGDCQYYYDCDNGICELTRANKLAKKEHEAPDCNPVTSGRTNCSDGYHIANDDGNALVTTSGKLWYCGAEVGGTGCEARPNAIGYFVNEEDSGIPSILCTVSANAQTCTKVSIGYADCDAVGKLREVSQNSGTYALCLDSTGSGVELTSVADKQLIIGIGKSNDLYGVAPNTIAGAGQEATKFNLVLSVTDNYVQLVKESTPVRYKYTNDERDTAPIIYDRVAAQTAKALEGTNICFNANTPYEYKLVQWVDDLNACEFADFYVANEE